MKELSDKNFGLLIAYLLPGFTAVWGMSYLSPTVHAWLGEASPDGPTVGGFLYVTLGSVAAGLTVSTVRWAVIDTFHHWTGLNQPQWDFAKLQANIAASIARSGLTVIGHDRELQTSESHLDRGCIGSNRKAPGFWPSLLRRMTSVKQFLEEHVFIRQQHPADSRGHGYHVPGRQ